MARGTLDPVPDYIHRPLKGGTEWDPNDADLLKQFVTKQEATPCRKARFVTAIFLAATISGTGTNAGPAAEPRANADRDPALAGKDRQRVDLYGDPLPQGAIARMGTTQFRHPPPEPRRLKYYLGDTPVTGVAFSPDGRVLATRRCERLRLWNANTGKFLFEIKNSDLGIYGDQAFSPDGRFIAANLVHEPDDPNKGPEAYVCLWDAQTGKPCHRFPPRNGLGAYVRHLLFSPDGKLLAMTHEKGTIHLWDTDTGMEVAVLPSRSKGAICSIAFSADGKTLVVLPYQLRRIWRWDVARGEVGKVVSLETLNTKQETEEGRTGTYHGYLLSNDGRTLACQFFGDPVVH
jgi:WD40 repeat protein